MQCCIKGKWRIFARRLSAFFANAHKGDMRIDSGIDSAESTVSIYAEEQSSANSLSDSVLTSSLSISSRSSSSNSGRRGSRSSSAVSNSSSSEGLESSSVADSSSNSEYLDADFFAIFHYYIDDDGIVLTGYAGDDAHAPNIHIPARRKSPRLQLSLAAKSSRRILIIP